MKNHARKLIALLALTSVSYPARAAIAFVQGATCHASGTSQTCAFSSAVSAGDLLILVASPFTASTAFTFTVTDSRSNTWTANGACFGSGAGQANEYYAANSAAGSDTVTVVVNTSTEVYLSMAEYSGAAASSPVDAATTCGTAGSTGTPTAPNITTTHANDLILASSGRGGNGGTTTVGSPYTMRTSGQGPLMADQIAGTVGTITGAAFTIQFTNTGIPLTSSFKVAGAGAATRIRAFVVEQ